MPDLLSLGQARRQDDGFVPGDRLTGWTLLPRATRGLHRRLLPVGRGQTGGEIRVRARLGAEGVRLLRSDYGRDEMITREFIENATPDKLIPLTAEITNDYLIALNYIKQLLEAGNILHDEVQDFYRLTGHTPTWMKTINWELLVDEWRWKNEPK